MKTTRVSIWFLSLIFIFATTTTAYAANNGLTIDDTYIYVDDKLQYVDCYEDKNGNIRVETVTDLYTVLPDLEDEVAVLPSSKGHIVVEYIDFLDDYTYYINDGCLYIYTDSYDGNNYCYIYDDDEDDDYYCIWDDDDDVIDIRDIIKYEEPDEPEETTLNVYLNGVRGPWSATEDELIRWAAYNGYYFRQNGNNVYLNNDGNKPIIIKVNNKEVEFPDQQPIIVDPGRTMIPIRAIADCIDNVQVDWNDKQQCVIIQNQNSKLVLWIGNSVYWLNNQYYNIDVHPYVLNGRTMVPIRFIAEAFGLKITYNNNSDIAIVNLSSSWQ